MVASRGPLSRGPLSRGPLSRGILTGRCLVAPSLPLLAPVSWHALADWWLGGSRPARRRWDKVLYYA